jgi:prepilin-type N-terminal cleavage/methylation domain-containing protein
MKRTNKTERQGFTLVELMVALLAGSIAVSGVFYLNGVSSRAYNEQMRVSEVQLSLRSAMEQLRRDFSRIGYLAAPSSTLLANCSGTIGAETGDHAARFVQAVQVEHNGSPAAAQALLSMTGGTPINVTRADRLVATGNYATADAYIADPDLSTDLTIVFQADSESFRRSFFDAQVDGTPADDRTERFVAAFENRMVRLENDGRVFFRDVASAQWTGMPGVPSITLATPLPSCFRPSTWTGVAPVVRVQYQLETDTSGELARLAPPTQAPGDVNVPPGRNRTLLVRRELTPEGAIVAGSSRVLLDYAVEFSVDAITNANVGTPTARPEWALVRGAALTATPAEAFRSLIVTLSSRSSDADPRLPHLPRANLQDPLLTFRVVTDAAFTANARVRTMRSEIFLQNL